MQLRASGERAVLVGYDGVAEREMDPRRLPLGAELTDALHEWAKVAYAIRRSAAGSPGGAGAPKGSAIGPGVEPARGSADSAVAGSAGGAGSASGLAGDPAGSSAAVGRVAGGSAARLGAAGSAGGSGVGSASGLAGDPAAESRGGSAADPAGGLGVEPAGGHRVAGGSAADPAGDPSAPGPAGSPAGGSPRGSAAGPAGEPVASPAVTVAAAVVSRRGLQLAAQVAASMGVSVSYVDPLSGKVSTVEPPPGVRAVRMARPVEPAPWLTGLAVSAAGLVLVAFMMVTLAVTLAESHPGLALAANVVVTAGLVPSLWLIHRQPIWRWVAYGAAAGIALGWLALPFTLL